MGGKRKKAMLWMRRGEKKQSFFGKDAFVLDVEADCLLCVRSCRQIKYDVV